MSKPTVAEIAMSLDVSSGVQRFNEPPLVD
jgi:hypothetical protein